MVDGGLHGLDGTFRSSLVLFRIGLTYFTLNFHVFVFSLLLRAGSSSRFSCLIRCLGLVLVSVATYERPKLISFRDTNTGDPSSRFPFQLMILHCCWW